MTKEEAINKLQRYCAYRDRCHYEVRSKLLSIKVYGDMLEEVMSELIKNGYLNEERYACSYARGKYRIKGWGKTRIIRELKARHISDYCIKKALQEVDEEGGYEETLKKLLEKYIDLRMDSYSLWSLRKKAYAHGISKGYESNLVATILSGLLHETKQDHN